MPQGPIICSPNRTFASLIREVVRRKPQEFKIPVLMSIAATFTPENPFVGGFGNRPTDAQSYMVSEEQTNDDQRAGVEKTKIFIINTKGNIKYETAEGEQTTDFIKLEKMCDTFFPPLFTLQRQNAVDDESMDALQYNECLLEKSIITISSVKSWIHLNLMKWIITNCYLQQSSVPL